MAQRKSRQWWSEWGGVLHAELPNGLTAEDWSAFSDAQVAKVDNDNDRACAAIANIEY